MADPFSIVAGVIGIADIGLRTVEKIKEVRRQLASIEQDLEDLSADIESLVQLCSLIRNHFETSGENLLEESGFSGKSKLPSHEAATGITPAQGLWKYIGKNIESCETVVRRLEAIFEDIHGAWDSDKANFKSRYTKVTKKKSREDEIRQCRKQLEMYHSGLNLILTVVRMHDTKKSQDQSAHFFEKMTQDFRSLEDSIQVQISEIPTSKAEETYDSNALAAMRELQSSIESAVKSLVNIPRNKHFDIPQSVSSIFTGREPLLKTLSYFLTPPPGISRCSQQRRFVVHGLGGSGKTQLCCKFAQDNRDSFWGVFWADGSTEDLMKQTLGNIAKEYAGLESNSLSALHWLSNLEHNWLLIIDNADDPDIDLQNYFPKGTGGSILITTRNPHHKMHGNVGTGHFEVGGLDFKEATALLLKTAQHPAPWESTLVALAERVAKKLGYLALALIHAGSAVRNRLCSLKEYMDYHNRSLIRMREEHKEREISKAHGIIYAGWEFSYKRLEVESSETANDATQLLRMFAFFHRESISLETLSRAVGNAALETGEVNTNYNDPKMDYSEATELTSTRTWIDQIRAAATALLTLLFTNRGPKVLPAVIRKGRDTGDVADSKDRILRAMNKLEIMSLIMYNENNKTYSMHTIVHDWARERFEPREQCLWAGIAGRVLAASILLPPLGTGVKDETYHLGLLPHIEHVHKCLLSIEHRLKKKQVLNVHNLLPAVDQDRILMLAKFSVVYIKCGVWDQAEMVLREVRNFLESHLGPTHERTRRVNLILADVYYGLGRGPDAQRLQESTLEGCMEVLGPDHQQTFRVMAKLGRTLWLQGYFTPARSILKQAVQGLSEKLGESHPDTLHAMDNLGLVLTKFWRPENWTEAHKLHDKAAMGMEKAYGPEDSRTLGAKENRSRTAVLLGGDSARQLALDTMKMVVRVREARGGVEHPETLLSMANLAIVQMACGDLAEAEEIIVRGMPMARRTLGDDHIGTLFGRHTQGCLYVEQERYHEATEILVDVCGRQERMVSRRGKYHPDRLVVLIELAKCYYLQGRIDQSLETADEAIAGFETITTADHPLAYGMIEARRQIKILKAGHKGYDTTKVEFPYVLFRPD